MGVAGGFTGVRAVYVQPRQCGGPISTVACSHLSFSIPNFLVQEMFPVGTEDDRLDLVAGHAARPRQVRPGQMDGCSGAFQAARRERIRRRE